ncbi:adenine deaminase C-terminal domain-containing protein [Thermaerobacter composti]|uniref:adenine deaminase n=1 Tax=Thermaerobacter composti TaxID=554949 RepID=A0ABZ0QN59_9FIRM|nr:adenine deaminase C-terminal domain-containing protein [Thermaerobacter composti]WPD18114.1 adenine deaminase C-terminal domain-containing protein [Thermaerobacter composti]
MRIPDRGSRSSAPSPAGDVVTEAGPGRACLASAARAAGARDWRHETAAARELAVRVAMGRRPPDVWFRGGTVLNVYTGRWEPAEVWVAGARIAYVGPDRPTVGPDTRVVDCRGRYLVPGYLEIHAHPFQLYSPRALGAAIAPRGTTTLVSDTLLLGQMLGRRFPAVLDAGLVAPVRDLWGLRVAPQSVTPAPGGPARSDLEDPDFAAAYGMTAAEGIALLQHPRIVEIFEWTRWADTLRREAPLPAVLAAGLQCGLAVDGHAPGASHRTLAALAAAGVGDCHESIRADEVLARVRLGLFAILRHSSLRPDLPALIAAAREAFAQGYGHRLALTTDGPTPAMVERGFLDLALRVAMEAGLEPDQAYRMATINPATYLGLDRYLGAIAPGRLADVNVLQHPEDPVPLAVWIDGRPVAQEGRLVDEPAPLDWDALGLGARRVAVGAEAVREALRFAGAGHRGRRVPLPVIRLVDAVITRWETREVEVDAEGMPVLRAEDDLLAALLFAPTGGRVTRALVAGFGSGIEGLASTYTMAGGMLVLGRRPEAMVRAAAGAAGGGIVLVEGTRVLFHLPLPLGGFLSDLDMPQLARRCRELEALLRERGYPYHDAIYSLLFLSADHLPGPRLTPAGLWDVKGHRLLAPAVTAATPPGSV